jgi:hypothetical protein
MADDKKTNTGVKPKKKGGKLGFIFFLILFGICAPFMMPTLTLLLVGLLPTFVALITDNDPHKSSTAAIGAMNFAGLTPFVIDLWVKGQTMENAFIILRQPSNWLIMLGAAGIGQLIVFAVPQAMASLTLARAESRLKLLKQNLEQLKAGWGSDVATTKPVDKIGKPD